MMKGNLNKGKVRSMCPVICGLIAVVAIAALMAGFGCGDSSDSASSQNEEFSLDAGADISTTETGVETIELGTVVNNDVFTAIDLPLEAGRELEFDASKPGNSTEVDFNLEGPGNFTTGADVATLTISMETKDSGFSHESFPDAEVVAVSSWSPSSGLVEYNFQAKACLLYT